MSRNGPVRKLQADWETFLVEQGHRVNVPKGIGGVLQSKDGAGKRYRWLLIAAKAKSRTLNRFELEDVKLHLKSGRESKQEVYVVVSFREPERKVIVMPAKRAVDRGIVFSDKGGVPWCD